MRALVEGRTVRGMLEGVQGVECDGSIPVKGGEVEQVFAQGKQGVGKTRGLLRQLV